MATGNPFISDQTAEWSVTVLNADWEALNEIAAGAISSPNRYIGTIEADELYGSGFNDVVRGLGGADILDGGGGDDLIVGGVGEDTIYLGAGNDEIWGDVQSNNSWLHADLFVLQGASGFDTIYDFDAASGDVLSLLKKPGLFLNEIVFAVSDGNTTISDVSTSWSVTLVGIEWDTYGSVPAGAIEGWFSTNGTSDNDLIDGTVFNDLIDGKAGNDTINGGHGNDLIYGRSGDDSIFGGEGADVIYGGMNNDWLVGDDGNDTLGGAGGMDFLEGGKGDDQLTGGAGDDLLIGRSGDDVMWGDDHAGVTSGADSFWIDANQGNDVIVDFDASEGDAVMFAFGMFDDFDHLMESVSEVDDGVFIDLGDGNSLLLLDVAVSTMDETSFVVFY